MGKHKSEQFKIKIVKKISQGVSVSDVVEEYGLPESTVYKWLSEYSEYETRYGKFTVKQYHTLERQNEDLRKTLSVVVSSPFVQSVPLQVREAYMEELQKKTEFPNHILCEAFDVDHATYHHYLYDNKKEKAWFVVRRSELERLICKIHEESDGAYGAGKILVVLRRKYHKRVSVDFVRRIMRENSLHGARSRRIKRKQGEEYKAILRSKNLLKQDFTAKAPNRKWVEDTKLFYCKGKRYYLCVVEDLYSRKIIAFGVGGRESGRLVAAVLRQAIMLRKIRSGLILHTDGSQANSSVRVNHLLRVNGIAHSYSEAANPYDNSTVESFFSQLTREFLVDAYNKHPFHSVREMKERIAGYVENYNAQRLHSYNGGKTPNEKEREWRRRYGEAV